MCAAAAGNALLRVRVTNDSVNRLIIPLMDLCPLFTDFYEERKTKNKQRDTTFFPLKHICTLFKEHSHALVMLLTFV